jgi:hypothetical protein
MRGMRQDFINKAAVLQETMRNRPGGVQRLLTEAADAFPIGQTRDLGTNQEIVVNQFKTVIPGEYTSIPALITEHPQEVIGILRSPKKIEAAGLQLPALALLAATTFPEEEFQWLTPIPKPKTETDDHKIFRLAMAPLISMGKNNLGLFGQSRLTAIQERSEIIADLSRPPDEREKAREERDTLMTSLFVIHFFLGLESKYFTQESARAELERVARRRMLMQDWLEVFRVEPRGQRGETQDPQATGVPKEQVLFENNPRINHLKNLAVTWNPNNDDPELEPQVRELRFRRQSKTSEKVRMTDRYFVALLPQKLPDGRIITHGVFDSDKDDNALFVYRGERELQTGLNWAEVFDKRYKTDVVKYGAKKMTHQGDWQTRVEKYLKLQAHKLEPVQI